MNRCTWTGCKENGCVPQWSYGRQWATLCVKHDAQLRSERQASDEFVRTMMKDPEIESVVRKARGVLPP